MSGRGNTVAMQRHIPERTCVGCGQKRPKKDLVRIVRTPQGGLLVDFTGKNPGRGAYLCHDSSCWTKGTEKRNLSRSLNLEVTTENMDRLFSEFQTIAAATFREK